MACNRLHSALAGLALAAALAAQAAPAAAQTYYRGYDIGPDYQGMLNQSMRQQQELNARMQQNTQGIIAQVMQDPQFQALYQQHRMQGGQMTPQQFAYQYAATGRFSREGTARYRENEARNQAAEQQRLQGLREAEAARGQAQRGYQDSYQRNNAEVGNLLRGNSTYIGPNGQSYVLPHTQPGQIQRDPNTGNAFVMDNRGQYYMYTPNGWQPMQAR
ncbi:MAG: hypothetical protein J0H01_31075 [Rhizobiales bacterium]|nr:hypothetical protein [Hyphomicrobiales bacterium]